jgi:nitrogen-specific signal transduction histidine kinase
MNRPFVFALDNAGWPALLVDSSLHVVRANSSAARLFDVSNEPEDVLLSAIWAPQNPNTAAKFLDEWERAPVPNARLKFRVRGGEFREFGVSICAFFKEGGKFFLLQLLPESSPAAAEANRPEHESGQLQRQKLECALQLARTVALDFNNALTSILGHTSLVLSRMEPDHPWRRSLL